jgi:hypothetical protein
MKPLKNINLNLHANKVNVKLHSLNFNIIKKIKLHLCKSLFMLNFIQIFYLIYLISQL